METALPLRLNKFIAQATGMSRRAADDAIAQRRVRINGQLVEQGTRVSPADAVTLDGKPIQLQAVQTILFNKPISYVVSRDGQGSKTIYDLLPSELHHLKPVGRLDKDSSGLLLLTNNGTLADELTHPRNQKTKQYQVTLDAPLAPLHRQMISDFGIQLTDGPSRLQLERIQDGDETQWIVTMHEGRNRQIRRTFEALGYAVTRLHRTHFGPYALSAIADGQFTSVKDN